MKKVISTIVCTLIFASVYAQNYSYSDMAKTYELTDENGKKVVTGFVSYNKPDLTIFANTLLWAIENISTNAHENIKDINYNTKSFTCNVTMMSEEDSKLKNTYTCKLKFNVNEGRLVFYISDICTISAGLISQKIMGIESLQPEKKPAHKNIIEEFVTLESKVLNQLFDYVNTYKLSTISHLDEIKMKIPVKGMNEDECRLAFGKPQAILESNGETQWMYSSSFYLFLRNGKLSSFIK